MILLLLLLRPVGTHSDFEVEVLGLMPDRSAGAARMMLV
jgi:hypothetical protein